MTNRKKLLKLILALACSAVIVGLGVGCGEEIDPDYPCGVESMKLARRTHDVLVRYYPFIMRLPHNPQPEPEFLRDENGELTDTWGIVILTDEEIYQYALNAEDRIPDSLEGVPVQILPREIGDKDRPWFPGWRPDDDEWATPHSHFESDVSRKNRDLFQRYPFYSGRSYFFAPRGKDLSDSDPIFGIEVHVTEKVDPGTLAPEDRIPDCLDDVPVRIILDPRDQT